MLATCGLAGYLPKAPGTAGTVVGLGVCLLPVALGAPPLATFAAATVVLTALSVGIGERCVADYTVADPSWFVLDEAAGIALALACSPGLGPLEILATFILFRVLDVLKPPPIAHAERLPGGYGITADDLIAGAAAGLLVRGGALWLGAGVAAGA